MRRYLAAALLWVLLAGGGWADDGLDALAGALRLDEVAAMMRTEGRSYGAVLDADMLDGQGGDHWFAEVDRVYARTDIAGQVRAALAAALSPDQMATSIAFLTSPTGRKIVSLEISARAALEDEDIEQVARDIYESLKRGDDARLAQVREFVAAHDLLERNVAGALSFSYQFLNGLVDGGGLKRKEAEILADVWANEDETRAETESWLYGYLLMAYRPLTDAELAENLAFARTRAGQALNAALFAGFDAAYLQISYELGVALAAAMMARDL